MPGPISSSTFKPYETSTDACTEPDSGEAASPTHQNAEPEPLVAGVEHLTARYRTDYSGFLAAQAEPATSAESTDPKLTQTRRAVEFAEVAQAVYGGTSVPGWHRLESAELEAAAIDPDAFQKPDSGFKAGLFRNEHTGEFVLAFAGTEDWTDWQTNFAQGAGELAAQYRQAVDLAVTVTDLVGQTTMVGHSLGGGMASAAAIASRNEAVTFNAAGVHANTIAYARTGEETLAQAPWVPGGTSQSPLTLMQDRLAEGQARDETKLHVTNYRTSGELLTTFQALTPDSPSAQGKQVDVRGASADYSLWNPLDRVRLHDVTHSIDALRGRAFKLETP